MVKSLKRKLNLKKRSTMRRNKSRKQRGGNILKHRIYRVLNQPEGRLQPEGRPRTVDLYFGKYKNIIDKKMELDHGDHGSRIGHFDFHIYKKDSTEMVPELITQDVITAPNTEKKYVLVAFRRGTGYPDYLVDNFYDDVNIPSPPGSPPDSPENEIVRAIQMYPGDY